MDMPLNWIILAVVAVLAFRGGFFVARKSAAKKPIKGGTLATAFHYIAVTVAVALSPMLLVMAFVFHVPFLQYSGICLGFFLAEFVALILYAVFESQSGKTATS